MRLIELALAFVLCAGVVAQTVPAPMPHTRNDPRQQRIFSGTNEVTFARGIVEIAFTNAVVLRQYHLATHASGSNGRELARVSTKTLSNCIFVTNVTRKLGDDVWLPVQKMEPVVINGTRMAAFDHGRPLTTQTNTAGK